MNVSVRRSPSSFQDFPLADRSPSRSATAQQALAAPPRGPGVEKSSNVRAHCLIAAVHRSRRDFASAIRSTNDALAIDPASVTAAVTKAQAFVGLGEMDLAIKTLDSISKLAPAKRTPVFMKGLLLLMLSQPEEALREFDRVLNIEKSKKFAPGNSRRAVVLSHQSRAYLGLKRVPEAEVASNEAVSLAPTNPAVLSDAARVKILANKPQEAISLINAAESVYQQLIHAREGMRGQSHVYAYFDLLVLKAGTLSKLGQFSEGLPAARKAVQMNPSNPTANLMLARLLERSNKLSEALEVYTTASKTAQGSDAMACWGGMSALYTKLGNEKMAQQCLVRAAAYHPDLKDKLAGVQFPGMAPAPPSSSSEDFRPVN